MEDAEASVVHSLVVSSLNSHLDKSSVAFQMFKIYQQYPDSLLRAVITKLRSDKMVRVFQKRAFFRTKACSPNKLTSKFVELAK